MNILDQLRKLSKEAVENCGYEPLPPIFFVSTKRFEQLLADGLIDAKGIPTDDAYKGMQLMDGEKALAAAPPVFAP